MFLQRTHKLGDGVPGHGGVDDPVLPDGTLCVVPADGEGAGGGIEHAHVPGTSARHCSTKHIALTPATATRFLQESGLRKRFQEDRALHGVSAVCFP